MTLQTALGTTLDAHLEALRLGTRGLRAPPIDVPFNTVTGTLLESPQELPDSLASFDSRAARLAFAAADPIRDAVEVTKSRYGSTRVALLTGTSTGGIDRTEEAYFRWAEAPGPLPNAYHYPTQHPFHAFTDMLATSLGIDGPRYVVSTACSSSGKIFASAERLISLGIVDAVLLAGVDALCHTTVRGFHDLGVMADEPCRPFGADRPGMNVGEAGAFLLLEKTSDNPIALLRGVGETSDAYHMSSPAPDGEGAQRAMRAAMDQAGLKAKDIDYVNAHGTGTKYNDAAEAVAIEAVLGTEVPTVSTKALTGHTLGACGAVEAILTLLSLQHGFVPPAVGAEPLDPDVNICVPTTARELKLRFALSNSFAFGGNNCSLLLEVP